jgi:hypothetical protein
MVSGSMKGEWMVPMGVKVMGFMEDAPSPPRERLFLKGCLAHQEVKGAISAPKRPV